MAIVLVIEAIFEADLEPEQYGYRPKQSAQDAVGPRRRSESRQALKIQVKDDTP